MAVYKVEGMVFYERDVELDTDGGGRITDFHGLDPFIVYLEAQFDDVVQNVRDYYINLHRRFKQVRITEIKELPGRII